MPFRLCCGAASELSLAAAPLGVGASADSDGLSEGAASGWSAAVGGEDEEGDEFASRFVSTAACTGCSCGKAARRLGERRRTTILERDGLLDDICDGRR